MCAGVGPLAYIAGLAGLRPGFLEQGEGGFPIMSSSKNFSTRISSRERSGRELFSGTPVHSGGSLEDPGTKSSVQRDGSG